MKKVLLTQLKVCVAIGALSLGANNAMATEGYFANGAGARAKALAGAGAADARDATAIVVNPAGLADLKDSEIDISVSLFNPNRSYTVTGGPGFLPAGTTNSGSKVFPIPNFALAYRVSPTDVVGLSISGNGGLNTNYGPVTNPACGTAPFPAPDGTYCGGPAGVNMMQMFVSAAYAHDFGPLKIGISPILAYQRFTARGVLAFGGVSSDPTALSDNGYDSSTGFGARFGVELAPTPGFRIGGAYQTKMSMGQFKKYAGLFADQGGFDIPSTWQVGVAADVTPQFTLMADYRRINYSEVPSVGNPSSVMLPFGSTDGPGFGWKDVEAWKFGAEYRMRGGGAVRVGYAHNTQPISGSDVTLNVLAPGVIQDHFTAGGSIPVGSRSSFEVAAMYAPTAKVSGIEVTPMGPNPGRTIEIQMNQFEFTLGWKLKL
ncbi:OmpP1/FadL family transporter [Tsuneonella mangrovi]|uniref:OmpP1/FadL family transporter n=1 Tax=Tsuneonella mangrovi TaxID=1982042 RepID=UPI000BA244BB|nr:outer membrane protein transport protein [Tsuneonella mangrovi]